MRRRTRLLVLAPALVALTACSSDSSPGGHSATTTTAAGVTTTTGASGSTPEDTVARYVLAHGHQYVGDCASGNVANDVGKWCSLLQADRGATRIYGIGPVASQISTVLTLHRKGGRWTVTTADPAPVPE